MCEFCETYKQAKKAAAESKKETGVNTYFRVKLFEYSVRNRVRKGSMTYASMKLVYCPTCGKKL